MVELTARSMLFDIFGDFATEGPRGGVVALGALVKLGEDLGVGEAATRAAANRMVQDGWLAARRRGRASVYALSPRGHQLVEDGRQRIFQHQQVLEPWDGTWCLIAISVPEARREVRDQVRKRLDWLGFGSPSPGVYLTPHKRYKEVARLADELQAAEYVQVYSASVVRPTHAHDLVARAWTELGAVEQRYAEFVRRFSASQRRTVAALRTNRLADREAFVLRFGLVNQFRACLFGDPDLPVELLPKPWSGSQARQLFDEYHQLVTPQALGYFDALAGGTV
jgi:phenylacetic acid degradation operon negative regulatory protein